MHEPTTFDQTMGKTVEHESANNPCRGMRVLDGGLATELEFLGADLSGPLWSAHVLERQPDLVSAVHRAYLDAGAECIATASYQVSRRGYSELGLSPEHADAALLHAVELAVQAREGFPGRRALVAASLGPLGAALHNGGEYHGNYDCSFDDLVRFHRERIAVLAASTGRNDGADLLAFETVPSLNEAQAILKALAEWPALRAWISFTCRDGEHVAHGEPLRDCAAAVAASSQVVAIGVNCVAPRWIPSLIRQLQSGCSLPILVYPNSGESWNAAARRWTGTTDPSEFGALAAEWYGAGAQIVGGCCRTRPEHVRRIATAARALTL